MKGKLWTAANVVMLLMFVLSTVVQFNDPDAPVWIAIYAAAAALCFLEIRRRTPLWLPVAILVIAFAWSGYIGQRVHGIAFTSLFAQWEMKDIHVEEAREMYGLLIVAVWSTCVAVAVWLRRNHAFGPESKPTP